MSHNDSSWTCAPEVFHEIIEGEAVIVSMNSGIYYSAAKTAAAIWDLLVDGNSVDQIVAALGDRYRGDRAVIADSVQRLIDELQQEGLIVAKAEAEPVTPAAVGSAGADEGDRPEFEEPILQKYTDMEQLLLLDPIHDVDESGWPTAKADGE